MHVRRQGRGGQGVHDQGTAPSARHVPPCRTRLRCGRGARIANAADDVNYTEAHAYSYSNQMWISTRVTVARENIQHMIQFRGLLRGFYEDGTLYYSSCGVQAFGIFTAIPPEGVRLVVSTKSIKAVFAPTTR